MARLYAYLLASAIGGAILATIGLSPPFTSRIAFHSVVGDVQRRLVGKPYVAYDLDQPIVCWGDSLTAGAGSTLGHDYPYLLSTIFHRRTVNRGVGGESSADIKTRFLKRTRPLGPEAVVIWAGRNNFKRPEEVVRDIADMVGDLNPKSRYLVIGITNAAMPGEKEGEALYKTIQDLNDNLHAIYGTRFVPILDLLQGLGNPRFSDDVQASHSKLIPPSLRSDQTHLNDIGDAEVAFAVERALRQNGW